MNRRSEATKRKLLEQKSKGALSDDPSLSFTVPPLVPGEQTPLQRPTKDESLKEIRQRTKLRPAQRPHEQIASPLIPGGQQIASPLIPGGQPVRYTPGQEIPPTRQQLEEMRLRAMAQADEEMLSPMVGKTNQWDAGASLPAWPEVSPHSAPSAPDTRRNDGSIPREFFDHSPRHRPVRAGGSPYSGREGSPRSALALLSTQEAESTERKRQKRVSQISKLARDHDSNNVPRPKGVGVGYYDRTPPTPLAPPDTLPSFVTQKNSVRTSEALRESPEREKKLPRNSPHCETDFALVDTVTRARLPICDPRQHMDNDIDDIWWQDAVILGRLAALGVQFYAGNLTRKSMKIWKRYMRYRYRKQRVAYLRRKQVQFRLFRMRIMNNSPTYRPYIDAIKRICLWINGGLRVAFRQMHKNVFRFRDMQRRVALFQIFRSRLMERIAMTHLSSRLLRLGMLALRIWARWVKDFPEIQDKKYETDRQPLSMYSEFISDVVTRALVRWRRNIDFHMSTEEYIAKYTEQWLMSVPGVMPPIRRNQNMRWDYEVPPAYTPWHLGTVASPRAWRVPFPDADDAKEVPELEFARRMHGALSSNMRRFCVRDKISFGPFLTDEMKCDWRCVSETRPLTIPPQRSMPEPYHYSPWGHYPTKAAPKPPKPLPGERASKFEDKESDDDLDFYAPDPRDIMLRVEPGTTRFGPLQARPGGTTYQTLRNRINPDFLNRGFQLGSRTAGQGSGAVEEGDGRERLSM
eukprot:GEMP01009824.1.p1 GENE.GEMP01009824.1~~GEMP01009824.1.p1  ORF type:complete len:747 (+),score=155.69 GEMP01009824.1:330-2570(+)